jgi:hypothetical protein
MKTKYIFFALLLAIATSCEKVIEVNVKDADQQLVIEGVLNDDGGPATVSITRSLGLSAYNNFPAVNNATVVLSDDSGNTYPLTLTSDGVYQAYSVTTVAGRKYSLAVDVDGKTYNAQSVMPAFIPFDSLGIDSISFGMNVSYQFVPYHYDPPVVKNYYRFKIFVNGVSDKNIYVDNDDFTDGRYVSRPFFSDMDMKPGDVITMEMYNIDPEVYLYFFSLSQSGNGPDASATPANPISNFSGGCLGYFSAQTKQIRNAPIPH